MLILEISGTGNGDGWTTLRIAGGAFMMEKVLTWSKFLSDTGEPKEEDTSCVRGKIWLEVLRFGDGEQELPW